MRTELKRALALVSNLHERLAGNPELTKQLTHTFVDSALELDSGRTAERLRKRAAEGHCQRYLAS